jgi:DNA invertase Pin-like site-specific DNA recombinase
MCIYGYCRISRKSQNIERQVRNILGEYPSAHIVKETYTGTRFAGRKELDKLLKILKPGDTVVFDSASRLSREEEAVELYENLFSKEINLVFLKEPHINTDVYRKALESQINIIVNTGNTATDNLMNSIIEDLNRYTIEIAKEQIRIVFAQGQKEVQDLRRRTAEGLVTARMNGKQIGQKKDTVLNVKKKAPMKADILRLSRDFHGTNTDKEVMQLTGLARNTYYKYKKELREEV